MSSPFLPYATTPGRLAAQLFSDAAVVVWTAIWVLVGVAVHSAISTIAEAGRQVESGSKGIAGAGHSLDATASWLAVLLTLAIVAPPILVATLPWLFLQLRFCRRKWMVTTLAAAPAGRQLLALRALTNRSPRTLAAISADPVGAWRREDSVIVRKLAALELRAAGVIIGPR